VPRVLNKRDGLCVDDYINAIYVGRPTIFGNPFVVGVHGIQGECVELFREWINLPEQETLRQQAREILVGRDLICWCAPASCHADILLEIANS
jgi:hypothetical protein